VYEVITGGLTVIEKALDAVEEAVEAEIVKLNVVEEPTVGAFPVKAPVDEFKVIPEGKEPDDTEYVIVSPSGSVAVTTESREADPPFLISPNVPDAVVNMGLASTFKQLSNCAERPERFVTFISYGSCACKKSVLSVTVAVTCDELSKVTVFADTFVPELPKKSTVAPEEKREPVITIEALPLSSLPTKPDTPDALPSTEKAVIVGGASIDFQSIPL
jgi:hypothetical protein